MTGKVWEVMNDLEMIASKICSAREIIDTAVESIQKNEYDKAETLAMAAYEFLGYYLDEFDEKFKLAWKETVVNQKPDSNWEELYYKLHNRFKRFAKYADHELDEMCDNKEKEDPCMTPWGHSVLEYLSKNNSGTEKKTWDIHNQTVRSTMSCDGDDPSPECKGAWNSFWEESTLPASAKVDGYFVDGMGNSEYYYDYTRNDPNRSNPFIGKVYESPNGGKTVYARNPGEKERTLVKEDKVIKWQLPVETDGPSGEYFVTFPDDLLEAVNLKEGDQVEWVDRGDGSYLLRKITSTLKMDEC
jgi:hypothetical protein